MSYSYADLPVKVRPCLPLYDYDMRYAGPRHIHIMGTSRAGRLCPQARLSLLSAFDVLQEPGDL